MVGGIGSRGGWAQKGGGDHFKWVLQMEGVSHIKGFGGTMMARFGANANGDKMRKRKPRSSAARECTRVSSSSPKLSYFFSFFFLLWQALNLPALIPA